MNKIKKFAVIAILVLVPMLSLAGMVSMGPSISESTNVGVGPGYLSVQHLGGFGFSLDNPKYLWMSRSGNLTDVSAGAIDYIDSGGGVVTVGAGVPLVIPGYGDTTVPTLGQFLANPDTPATQTTGSLGTGFYTIWIEGGTSVAISAGTATITGAGSATPGTPLTFEVTGAGTVEATVTGAVTRFNLTDQNYSTFPIYIDAVGSIASRAGTVSADSISTDFLKLLDALGGAADGDDVVINGDFTDWTGGDPDGWTVVEVGDATSNVVEGAGGGSCRIISDGTQANVSQFVLTVGLSYSYSLNIITVASGAIVISNPGGAGDLKSYNTAGIKTGRFIALSTTFQIKRLSACDVTFDDVSVKQISPASAALRTKIRFNIDADDLADGSYQLISSDEVNGLQLYYFKSGATREIRAFDGVNTASLALDAVADTIYSVGLCYGYHIASAARKMQIDVDGTTGALSDVEDAWPISNDAMVFGYNNDILTGLGQPIFSKSLWPGWRAQP